MIPRDILEPVEEGLRSKVGGEIVVVGDSGVGRMFLFAGRVAWALCTCRGLRLRDLLFSHGVSPDDLEAVVADCRAKGGNFAERLLEWGLIDAQVLRDTLLEHTAASILAITRMSEPRRALFAPQSRSYTGQLLFSWAELVDEVTRLDLLDRDRPVRADASSWPRLAPLAIRRTKGATTREVDGEAVVISLPRRLMHTLNRSATFVWNRADGTRTLEDILAALVAAFDVAPAQARSELLGFVVAASSMGLLELVELSRAAVGGAR